MGKSEKGIFQVELLEKGAFPKLDSKGKSACLHEIELWGIRQFLDDGWTNIREEDETLYNWLERLIRDNIAGKPVEEMEKASRSIRSGAALVYYPLLLQVGKSMGQYAMPKASSSQEGSLRFDLTEENVQSLTSFLLSFDPELTAVIGGFIGNPNLLNGLGMIADDVYLGVFFTYFVLANKAESLGMDKIYGGGG